MGFFGPSKLEISLGEERIQLIETINELRDRNAELEKQLRTRNIKNDIVFTGPKSTKKSISDTKRTDDVYNSGSDNTVTNIMVASMILDDSDSSESSSTKSPVQDYSSSYDSGSSYSSSSYDSGSSSGGD